MQERLKQEIKNLRRNEIDSVYEYINSAETELGLSKHLIFRKAVEFGNEEIFEALINREEVDIDACSGKPLISAVTWNREDMIVALLNSNRVNPKERMFKAYRLALRKCSKEVIELFEKKIHETELKRHEKIEIIRSFIYSNNYERFLESINNEKEITKKEYRDLLNNIVTKFDINYLKYFIEKNKELKIVPMGQIFQLVRKSHGQKQHLSLILENMKEEDFGYGNECIIRNLVKSKDYTNFYKVMTSYEFDFSLFDNKILKEALRKKVDMQFIKKILSHKSIQESFNQKWYTENKDLIDNYPNAHVVRRYLDFKKFEYF